MPSKIHIQKIPEYSLEAVEAFVRESVALFSGPEPLFSTGQKVMLKPNLLRAFRPERCVTTHPVVLEAVCRVLKDCSVGQIDISDSPAFGSLEHVAGKAGYKPLVKRYGVRLVPLKNPRSFPSQESITGLKLSGNIAAYDRIVNLPKFKSHCQMTLTLGIKNLFGLVVGKRKPILHCKVDNNKITFGKMLVDIAKHVNPCLTIVDGIQAMQGQGPANGTPYNLGILAAGQDLTALDRVLAELVDVPLESVYALEAARIKQFGNYAMSAIELVGETNLDALKAPDFQLAKIPLGISFHPWHMIKSFVKQIYQIGIGEKLAR